jgi:energy-coupling factor transport system substrate-specific component
LGFFFEKTRRINKMKKIGIKEVVATGIGTALFVVLTEVQIPLVIIPNTALQVRVAFLSAVYGPIVGLLVGFLGHALGDALFYGSVWWSWVFPDAIFGVIMGIFAGKYLIKEGGFGKKQIITFNIVQIVANAISWILVAPILDIVIYAEPANKVFAQGALAFVANVIIIAILGTLLGVAYSKIGGKSSSLKKED